MVVTSEVRSVFSKSRTEQEVLKSGFKNRHRIADENCLYQRVPDRRCWKLESMPREVCSQERLVQHRDGRWT